MAAQTSQETRTNLYIWMYVYIGRDISGQNWIGRVDGRWYWPITAGVCIVCVQQLYVYTHTHTLCTII